MTSLYPDLHRLRTKAEVDDALQNNDDLVVALRFGSEDHPETMALDKVLAKTQHLVSKLGRVYIVECSEVPTYVRYFGITLVPCIVFFFNTVHMKVDYGTLDHTKWVGCFVRKQDFIDLVEVIYRAALRGKPMARCPFDSSRVPHYDLLCQGY
eukprot:RCo055482